MIALSREEPLRYLATVGRVGTFRPERREETPPLGTEETDLVDGDGDHVADVEVRVFWADVAVESDELETWAFVSGFDDVDAWREAIREDYGDVDEGHIYEVVLRRWPTEPPVEGGAAGTSDAPRGGGGR